MNITESNAVVVLIKYLTGIDKYGTGLPGKDAAKEQLTFLADRAGKALQCSTNIYGLKDFALGRPPALRLAGSGMAQLLEDDIKLCREINDHGPDDECEYCRARMRAIVDWSEARKV